MDSIQEVHAIQHNVRVEIAYSKAMKTIQEKLSTDELTPEQYKTERKIVEYKREISLISMTDKYVSTEYDVATKPKVKFTKKAQDIYGDD